MLKLKKKMEKKKKKQLYKRGRNEDKRIKIIKYNNKTK